LSSLVCSPLADVENKTNELHKKALKVYYKLHTDLLTLNPNINTSLHVFDHTIKPILLYGCEIWGSFIPTTARFRNGTITFDKMLNLKSLIDASN
jgi:hypothetical protein